MPLANVTSFRPNTANGAAGGLFGRPGFHFSLQFIYYFLLIGTQLQILELCDRF